MRKKSELSAAETCTITRVVNFYIASGRIFYVMTFGGFGACGLMKTSIFTINNSDEDNPLLMMVKIYDEFIFEDRFIMFSTL